MSANSKTKNTQSEQEVDVLYQKLGGKWFAFSVVDDEVFMAPISEEQIHEIKIHGSPGSQNEAA